MANASFGEDNLNSGDDQTNFGLHVITGQVESTVHVFMAIILVMILIFLAVHIFIRFHYKAKTEYALNELREKYERNGKGPSAFALPKDQKAKDATPKQVEILMDPEQLAPIVHHVALAPAGNVEEPNKNICYKQNPRKPV
ncbi:hypothetical protein GCK72_005243 [Caenorhabditis remanei]|uniref:Uncharacterized protein n=1 Tax=Caenorhabditis remanei TaxID=31234 RepID=A0A6A5HEG1_CAERE|nr:hypothetical protein GCK72_005243 [Caenorhabditis remanei]KAF1765291.1 hypothetical protein GCK72_005243 [Caenorhabditis remanei]